MKNLLIIFIFLLNFNINAQDTIGIKKPYVNFRIHKGVANVKPYVIDGITPELRSTLKLHNDIIKNLSQSDSLMVFFGLTYSYPYKYSEADGKKMKIPNHYYRLLISLTTHKVISCVLFENSAEPTLKKVTVAELEHECKFFFERKLGYSLHEQ